MPEQSLIKEKSIRAWSGTKEDLLRLGEVIDGQFFGHRGSAAACPDVPREPGPLWPPWLLPKRRNQRLSTMRRLHEEWSVMLEVADSENRLVKDQYKRLLDNKDVALGAAVSLTLSCTVQQQSCTVRLTNRTPGSSYRVQGDPAWARETFATLQTEVKRAAPGWSFLRHPLTASALFGVFVAIFFAAFFFDDWPYWWALLVAAYVVPLLLWVGVNSLFPSFELREPSAKPRRQSLVRAAAAVLGLVVTGLTIAGGIRGLMGD